MIVAGLKGKINWSVGGGGRTQIASWQNCSQEALPSKQSFRTIPLIVKKRYFLKIKIRKDIIMHKNVRFCQQSAGENAT